MIDSISRSKPDQLLIILSIGLSSIAQILLKFGVMKNTESGPLAGFFDPSRWIQLMFHPLVLAGIAAYVASMLVWLIVLSKFELSYAYPFVALGIVLTSALGWLLQDDTMSVARVAGILMIAGGVVLVARS